MTAMVGWRRTELSAPPSSRTVGKMCGWARSASTEAGGSPPRARIALMR